MNLVDRLVEIYVQPHRDTYIGHQSLRAEEQDALVLPDGRFTFPASFVLPD